MIGVFLRSLRLGAFVGRDGDRGGGMEKGDGCLMGAAVESDGAGDRMGTGCAVAGWDA